MQYSRKSGGSAATKWSEDEIDIALDGKAASTIIHSYITSYHLSCASVLVNENLKMSRWQVLSVAKCITYECF